MEHTKIPSFNLKKKVIYQHKFCKIVHHLSIPYVSLPTDLFKYYLNYNFLNIYIKCLSVRVTKLIS